MLPQVALASAMIILTAGIQTLFTVVGVRTLRRHAIKERAAHLWRATLVVGLFVLWLFLATVFQVAAWALLYVGLDAFPDFEQAAYFSMVTFTTVGFGDLVLDENWRLLSAFESANGLLMFGWSTALIFAAVQWLYER